MEKHLLQSNQTLWNGDGHTGTVALYALDSLLHVGTIDRFQYLLTKAVFACFDHGSFETDAVKKDDVATGIHCLSSIIHDCIFPCIFPSQPQAQASLRPCTAKAIPATPERTIQSLAQSIGLIAISIPLGASCCCPTAVGMRNHSQDILVGVTSFSLDKRYMLIYIYVYTYAYVFISIYAIKGTFRMLI